MIMDRMVVLIILSEIESTNQQQKSRGRSEIMVRVFAISEQSVFDGPGTRMVIFFQGCNIGCSWCHSPHSQQNKSLILFYPQRCMLCRRCETVCEHAVHDFSSHKHILIRSRCVQCGKCVEACPGSAVNKEGGVLYLPTKTLTVSSLMEQVFPYLSLCDGITLSGGEALLQTEACIAFLKECKKRNIHTALETSGLLPQSLYLDANPYVDVWLWGIRVMTGENRYTNLELQESNALLLSESADAIIPRITVVPNLITQDEALRRTHRILTALGQKDVWVNPWNKSYDVYYRACGLNLPFPKPSADEIKKTQSDLLEFLLKYGYDVINYSDLLKERE